MPRPTIHDVADAARLSLATVDRVLNNRGGVAEKSVRKVTKAVAETGYVRDIQRVNGVCAKGDHWSFSSLCLV